MSSSTRLLPVHWVSNFEITDADQSIGPIVGILGRLRSNQWLVLFRATDNERTNYFPFKKSEIFDRLSLEKPSRIAAEALNLPDHGAEIVEKRISRLPIIEDEEETTLPRLALLNERGDIIGIGATRKERIGEEHTSRLLSESVVSENRHEVVQKKAFRIGVDESDAEPSRRAEIGEKANEPPSVIVPVFYGTDRKRLESSTEANVKYGNNRSLDEKVSLGICSVSIPQGHRVGKLERPPFWKIWARLTRRDHVMVLSTVELAANEFLSRLKETTQSSPAKDAFIFVHGYNVSFEDAALRTAQLATDLSFPGSPIMYSWPSKAGLAKYIDDASTIQWSRPHLKTFIEQVSQDSEAESIHVIAHSMGSRALLEIFQALSVASVPLGILKQLIFAAPDVDAGIFSQIAHALVQRCARVTLYASDEDKALKASRIVNGYSRAGQAGPDILVLNGVDTIDASRVDTDFLGHGGFATDRPLMQDVHALVHHNHEPKQRFGLEPKANLAGTYWSFKL